jgi:hypothetical protein
LRNLYPKYKPNPEISVFSVRVSGYSGSVFGLGFFCPVLDTGEVGSVVLRAKIQGRRMKARWNVREIKKDVQSKRASTGTAQWEAQQSTGLGPCSSYAWHPSREPWQSRALKTRATFLHSRLHCLCACVFSLYLSLMSLTSATTTRRESQTRH